MIGFLILIFFTIIPVKIGAEIFGAGNKEVKSCILAIVIGTALSFLSTTLIGGFLGFLASYVLVSVVYSKVLLFSFAGGLAFTLGVLLIQISITQALIDFGILEALFNFGLFTLG